MLRYLTVKVKKFDLNTNYFAKKDEKEIKESSKNWLCLKDKAEIKKASKVILLN